jgi:hypothetical protein
VSIKSDEGAFFGRIIVGGSSPNRVTLQQTTTDERCLARREVVLKKKRSGRDRKISGDRTNRRGRWRVGGLEGKQGTFYAIVKRKVARASGTPVICKRTKSDELTRDFTRDF